jgi:iron complex outermembrane receptor protein
MRAPRRSVREAPLPRWLLALCLAGASNALAQRADDNAVKTADDAFGTTVGNENIGLYNPFEVRGFSAVDAGNVRLDGLYFDRQTDRHRRLSAGARRR